MTDKSTLSNVVAIIPAAGIGQRMGIDRPKQYLCVAGKTILEHTVNILLTHPRIKDVVIAVAKADPWIETLALSQNESIHIVTGGEERSASVLAGLNYAKANLSSYWAVVHDAARPLVTHQEMDNLFMAMLPKMNQPECVGAILATKVKDTIKQSHLTQDPCQIEKTVPRSRLWAAQTPQLFPVEQLAQAITYCHDNDLPITDEASAIEGIGLTTQLVEGFSSNIKLTEPSDLAFIEFMLTKDINTVTGIKESL